MSLDLNQSSGEKKNYGRVEDGAYPCRIAQIIDLGKQHEIYWENGKPLYYKHDEEGKRIKGANGFEQTTDENDDPVIRPKVWITYELPTETIDVDGEEKPRWMSKEYTISNADNAALMKVIKAVVPKGFNSLRDLLGKAGTINIGSTRTGNAKIVSVGPPMKGMSVAELSKEPVLFDLDSPDLDVFNSLPNFLQEKIKNGVEFNKSKLKKLLDSGASNKAESKAQKSADSFDNFDDDSDAPF